MSMRIAQTRGPKWGIAYHKHAPITVLKTIIQWCSSAPKSGGGQTFFKKSEKQKKKVTDRG